ncbi:hypothetical protein SVAN01_02225 [Stagonosporopsis vannaccii]|nr:hypothetical protein SVAN01_02225 [Stagonosporopsis vannaccii]
MSQRHGTCVPLPHGSVHYPPSRLNAERPLPVANHGLLRTCHPLAHNVPSSTNDMKTAVPRVTISPRSESSPHHAR